MNTQNQALSASAELQQLADLKMDREICPQGRFVIAMMTACEIDTHCTEMLAHLRSQMGITFVGSDFAVLSFSGTRTGPGARSIYSDLDRWSVPCISGSGALFCLWSTFAMWA